MVPALAARDGVAWDARTSSLEEMSAAMPTTLPRYACLRVTRVSLLLTFVARSCFEVLARMQQYPLNGILDAPRDASKMANLRAILVA
jgi:hypothetical protein